MLLWRGVHAEQITIYITTFVAFARTFTRKRESWVSCLLHPYEGSNPMPHIPG